ncbi:MAG TPA: hypothetical protein VK116_09100 [Planctomycetota bacterium]|nr:hypothetical protein [Planctomycetota bacterium]
MFTRISALLPRLRNAWGSIMPRDDDDSERGDVPGWVLVTLMTATIVVGIWLLARPALEQLFDRAMTIIPGM